MKKLITISLLLIVLLSIFNISGAEIMSTGYKSYNINDSNVEYKNINIGINRSGKIENFWWTGKEILNHNFNGEYTKSENLLDWQEVSISDDVRRKISIMYEPMISYWGDKYIIYDKIYENPSHILSSIRRDEEVTVRPTYTLNNNFEIINEFETEDPLTDIGYFNNKYYIKTQHYNKKAEYKNTIYYSNDAVNWSIDEHINEIPMNNGEKNTLIFNQSYLLTDISNTDYQYVLTDMSVLNNKNNEETSVKFEENQYNFYEVIDNIYISYQKGQPETFKVSLDGVYWIDINLPEFNKYEEIQNYYWWKDNLLFRTDDRLIEYDIVEIRNLLNQKCPLDTPYIKFNNNILSFETPPVIEDGSTLVPMRFLFEQMGADVEWNQATQTAKAKLNNTAVTFSIDDIKASVNNTWVTMDVPARLINDKTMVPLRFLSEEMGFDVTWDDASRTAIIE